MLRNDQRRKFLHRFSSEERSIISALLEKFIFLSRQQIKDYFRFFLKHQNDVSNACFVGLGAPTESGNELLSDLRRASDGIIAVEQMALSHQWNNINLSRFDKFIFIDDFVGTGNQSTEFFSSIHAGFRKPITYVCISGLPSGLDIVRKFLKNRFPAAKLIVLSQTDVRNAFELGYVFDTTDECEKAQHICRHYGLLLKQTEKPEHRSSYPLGYQDSAALFATEYNTPNNTLPIFWSTALDEHGTSWPAPYPRSHKTSRIPRPPQSPYTLEHKMHEAHKVGNLIISKIAKYQRFNPPLGPGDIKTKLVPSKTLPDPLQLYYRDNIEKFIKDLRNKRKSVEINKGYSLHAVQIDKIQIDGAIGRKHIPSFEFEETDYTFQIAFGERINLDGTISRNNRNYSIREYIEEFHAVSFEHFDWSTIFEIPIPQRFANSVGVVCNWSNSDPSKGKALICALRSKAMAVSSESIDSDTWLATMSCAEGMLRPDDAYFTEGAAPTPFQTAKRALQTELGLQPGVHFSENDLRMLALAYDSNRCQPVASFLIELQNMDYEMIEDLWNTGAEDNNESPAIFPVPLNPNALSSLLRGDFAWSNHPVTMFSNQQQIGLLSVAQHYFHEKSLAI